MRRGRWDRRYPRRETRQRCSDCRIEISPESRHLGPRPGRWRPVDGSWHWYMVRDDVWEQAGTDGRGYLCVPCLERQLSRPLTVNDLADLAVNDPNPLDVPALRRLKEQLATALAWRRHEEWGDEERWP